MNNSSESFGQFLFRTVKPYKFYLGGMCLIALYWAINATLAPYVLKLIIDKVASFHDNKTQVIQAVQPLVMLYIGLWVAVAIAMRLLDYIKLQLFPSLRFDLITRMFTYLEGHSHHYFQNNFAGSLSNKINDMQAAVVNIFTTLDDAFAQSLSLCIAIATLLLVHPPFAFILLVWALTFILISLCFFSSIRDLSNAFASSRTSLVGKIVDSIGNISSVRLFARNSHESSLISEATMEATIKDRQMQWSIIKMRCLWDLSIIVLIVANISVLVKEYSQSQVSIGDFSFIMSLSISIFYNLWFLAGQFVVFSEEIGKGKQALSIMTKGHDIVDAQGAKPLLLSGGEVAFNRVGFHYNKGRALFTNKNVVIAAGQKVGLVGFSGSGKSTFVNLILRLFDVESGEITIDGQPINQVTQASLRENIAMIPQDIALFHRSLMDNIRYGRIDATDEEVILASKKAHCHEFISELPEQYQALVGERGIKLSGGQRQRLAIARAMLKNASILILDEATSSLDSVTEKQIQDGLHQLMANRTTIVIAHRLSTLSEMDRILVFDKGHIIEDGTHSDLIAANGHYAHMWAMQAGGFLPSTPEDPLY